MKERQDRLFELWKVIICALILLSLSTCYYMSENSSFVGAVCCGAIDLLLFAVSGVIFNNFGKPKN